MYLNYSKVNFIVYFKVFFIEIMNYVLNIIKWY